MTNRARRQILPITLSQIHAQRQTICSDKVYGEKSARQLLNMPMVLHV